MSVPAFSPGNAIVAITDGEDRLVEVAEPLLGLHLSCGGTERGVLAVPALLSLVRKARRYDVPLSRAIVAADGQDLVRAWAEVEPLGPAASEGARLLITDWQVSPNPEAPERDAAVRRAAIARAAAELNARLDSEQRVLAAGTVAPDLKALADRMNDGDAHWTTHVSFPGSQHRQPLHWRLLDGASCKVDGSERDWRCVLLPMGSDSAKPAGFELLLLSDETYSKPEQPPVQKADPTGIQPRLGRDLAPVLRQPVARIIANAETIRTRLAGPLADEYSDYAADIASAGEHLLSLIEDLADLEVVEAEGFVTAPDRIDLNDAARRAIGILGVRARERSITVMGPADDADGTPAVAEFRRVLQILLNLVGNAINYAPAGSTVTVTTDRRDDVAAITVADEGAGLSAQQQHKVFGKFERLGRSGDGGSGLGLYISRKLARAMGGELAVESAEGQGARFTLTLPAGN